MRCKLAIEGIGGLTHAGNVLYVVASHELASGGAGTDAPSVAFSVGPLKQRIEQKIQPQDAEGHKQSECHMHFTPIDARVLRAQRDVGGGTARKS